MQTHEARDVLAQFFLDVARNGAAWGLSCCGALCAVFGGGELCFPLWSSENVAREMQRRHWPNLVVTRVALDTILDDCIPAARANNTPFGLGVAVHTESVTIPVKFMEEALNAALELRRRRTVN
jgi:hypothetical protein